MTENPPHMTEYAGTTHCNHHRNTDVKDWNTSKGVDAAESVKLRPVVGMKRLQLRAREPPMSMK